MVFDALDRSLELVYRFGMWRVLGVLVGVFVVIWWMRREGDARAVAMVKESARLVEASMRKSGARAAADIGGALALVDAADRYEPNKSRLKRALNGVDPTTYKTYVKRTLDQVLSL